MPTDSENVCLLGAGSDQPRVKTALLIQCMVRPGVASGFAKLAVSGLASMYPASDWSVLCWPRLGHLGHQCSHAPGRPNLHLVSSSRRPRLETVDKVTSSLAPQIAQSLCSSQGPFVTGMRPPPRGRAIDLRYSLVCADCWEKVDGRCHA